MVCKWVLDAMLTALALVLFPFVLLAELIEELGTMVATKLKNRK